MKTPQLYNKRGELTRYGLSCGYKQTHGKTARVIYMEHGTIFVTDADVIASQGDAFVYSGMSLDTARSVWRTSDNAFVYQYLKTALWSSIGDDERPLDERYGVMCFDSHAFEEAKNDCQRFLATMVMGRRIRDIVCTCLDDAAHDFWLNRNGHGTGFWDKPEIYGAYYKSISDVAMVFACSIVYEYGDGKLSLA